MCLRTVVVRTEKGGWGEESSRFDGFEIGDAAPPSPV